MEFSLKIIFISSAGLLTVDNSRLSTILNKLLQVSLWFLKYSGVYYSHSFGKKNNKKTLNQKKHISFPGIYKIFHAKNKNMVLWILTTPKTD